ncbi:hypothetical protein [Paraburkholderia sp. RL17-373-BIF-A]|uniref:hypothetical protein n=1 Tax=Paraburkholderia sp. RL17-373-BIF-A TaxID=3031629 RepID=UPI0038B7412D
MGLRHHFPHCERSLCPSAAQLAADLPKKYFAEMRQYFQFTFLKSVSDWKPLALLAGLVLKCASHGRFECAVSEMQIAVARMPKSGIGRGASRFLRR